MNSTKEESEDPDMREASCEVQRERTSTALRRGVKDGRSVVLTYSGPTPQTMIFGLIGQGPVLGSEFPAGERHHPKGTAGFLKNSPSGVRRMPQTNPSKPHSMASDSVWKRRVWWLQSFILSTWIFLCFKIIHESIVRADEDVRTRFLGEVFLYYNPMFMIALVLWLWGINLWVFANSRISYAKVFDFDPTHLTHRDVWKISGGLTLTVLSSMSLYMYFYSRGHLNYAAAMPLFLYCALPLFLGLPLNVCHASSRFFLLNTLARLALPLQPITFADFIVADVLTSMAKVFSDMERALCTMYYYQVAKPQLAVRPGMCGSDSVWIPFILAFPYACRFFQCLRQYSDTRDKSCIFNALKYATAFPVIGLSALKYHIVWDLWLSRFRPLWLFFSLINSAYSFYWDLSRDWDFGCLSSTCQGRRKGSCLRPNLYFSRRWVYHWAIASNLVLRGAWTYKLSAHLRDYRLTAFTFSALEILRRFQWMFFRVENEFNKMNMRSSGSQISLKSMSPTTQEKESLLSSII